MTWNECKIVTSKTYMALLCWPNSCNLSWCMPNILESTKKRKCVQFSHIKPLKRWFIERYRPEKTNQAITKKPPGCRPPDLSYMFCLMAVMRYVCCVIWVVWIILSSSRRRVRMFVADGLVPIWRQDICNHHDDIGWVMRLTVHQFNLCVYPERETLTERVTVNVTWKT